MTATPIPRTLAITMNGDLDLTIIDELPKGRKPIITTLNQPKKQIYKLIRDEIEKGHQAYIVYPLIEESETLSAKAATKEAERLQSTVFSDLRIGLLHGKLNNSEKEKVMEQFKKKWIPGGKANVRGVVNVFNGVYQIYPQGLDSLEIVVM